MAIARFIPSMYESFLKDSATFKIPEDIGFGKADLDDYPHFVLFMSMHLGQAYYDEEIKQNIEKINKIPADEILATDATIAALTDKYELIYPGANNWD